MTHFKAALITLAFALCLGPPPARAQAGLRGVFVVTCRQPVWVFGGTIGGPPQAERTKARQVVAGEILPRGCTIATGKAGQVRCMIAGHTVLDIGAQAVVGVPEVPRGDTQRERRVIVYTGEVRTFTDARYLPPPRELVLVSPASRQATRRGFLSVRAAGSSGAWSRTRKVVVRTKLPGAVGTSRL